jgi:pimeloyl-CoA synthetase
MYDDFDLPVERFYETFHFYKNDTPELIDETIEKILCEYTKNNEIVINYRKYSQQEENQEFVQKIKKVITKLRTSL